MRAARSSDESAARATRNPAAGVNVAGYAASARRWAAAWQLTGLILPAVTVFAFHARWVSGHFSHDGYLCDSGWFAFLMEHTDPWMRNPRAVVGQACAGVNAPTYLAHHLSPHLWLFGAPFSLLRVPGTDILAYHQGLFFALVVLAFGLVATAVPLRLPERIPGVVAVVAVAVAGNAALQAAAYPHFEIALIGLASLAIAAGVRGYQWLFLLSLAWLPLIREDGGLYVTLVALAFIAIESGDDRRGGRRCAKLALVAGLGALASAVAFFVKATYFPGFEAFSINFAGDGWRHVTPAFVIERVRTTLTNWNMAPVLIGSLVLAAFDRRYLTGSLLLSPLLVVHMLSIRPEHGRFTLYYALPWILAVLLWLVVLVRRMGASTARAFEKALVAGLALTLSAPVQALIGTSQQSWLVVRQAFTRSVANVRLMTAFARSVGPGGGDRGERRCASMGIAALIPDDLNPQDVINPRTDLRTCRALLLLRGDMHYEALLSRAENARFRKAMERENAELWIRTVE